MSATRPIWTCRRCTAKVAHTRDGNPGEYREHRSLYGGITSSPIQGAGSVRYVADAHKAPCGCRCTVEGCTHNPRPADGWAKGGAWHAARG